MQKITVGRREEGLQLLKLLGRYLQNAPQSFFYKMLRKKNITLNGKKAEGREKLREGDEICLYLSDETIALFGGDCLLSGQTQKTASPEAKEQAAAFSFEIPFEILYEDEDLLFVNKPVGLLTQKAKPEDVSLNEHILSYLLTSGKINKRDLTLYKPGVCNRLDRNTSGIVTVGKTIAGAQFLSEAFRKRTVQKYYECIVVGEVKKGGVTEGYLYKNEKENKVTIYKTAAIPGASPIKTAYRPLCSAGGYTLLEVELITGKTHQIRAQLAAEGFPLLGDSKYGCRTSSAHPIHPKHQLLHAGRLEFGQTPKRFAAIENHSFEAPVPKEFSDALKKLHLAEE